jgi:AcrR family transcriptional regulator
MTPERPLRADARRNRESVLDAAAELFALRGDAVQMDEIAERAGLGVGTVYRHFVDKQALLAAIIGRRAADESEDPWAAFETLLFGYLESAQADAAFRFALIGPQEPRWSDIAAEKTDFSALTERIVRRAIAAGRLREDFRADDFVLITRGAMANMTAPDDWRRHVALVLEGIRGPAR